VCLPCFPYPCANRSIARSGGLSVVLFQGVYEHWASFGPAASTSFTWGSVSWPTYRLLVPERICRGIPRMLSKQRESPYLVEDPDLQLTGTSRFSIQASRSHCLYRTHFGPRRMNGISFLSQRHCARVSGERRIISATSSVVSSLFTWDGLSAPSAVPVQGLRLHGAC
jgi:hypothetical protein